MQGGCLCGAVRYEVSTQPITIANCHCGMCRRHSGAAFLTYAAYATNAFEILSGRLTKYRSSNDAVRSHCQSCGSPLTFSFDADESKIWVTAGSLDNADDVKPTENWYVDDKLDWIEVDLRLSSWPGAPPN